MNAGVLALIVTIMVPLFVIAWNRSRVKGKMLCVISRKDKSVVMQLCQLWNDFVIFEDRAYDVYPDFVRLTRFPMGWPAMLQELVPTALYDEEDAIPKDWITMEKAVESSMNLRSALRENWVQKLVHEAATEGGGGFRLNWRKILPIGLIAIGVIGLVVLLSSGGMSCA